MYSAVIIKQYTIIVIKVLFNEDNQLLIWDTIQIIELDYF